jgi:phosphoglycolate phosphatase-like HAD superfamily hydrolase
VPPPTRSTVGRRTGRESCEAARRARALSISLLSGGYGRDELERAGAYRVYEDPADLLAHVDELGLRPLE